LTSTKTTLALVASTMSLAQDVSNSPWHPDLPLIDLKDYTYDLEQESIAIHPAYPRGSSRLLQVKADGSTVHHATFEDAILDLIQDGLVVLNTSRVVPARVMVMLDDSLVELMILDLGELTDQALEGARINVMIRRENLQVGTICTDASHRVDFVVVDVVAPWYEDEDSQGNGTECIVQAKGKGSTFDLSLFDALDMIGSIPIPPYLNREVESSDIQDYNTVHAVQAGSVAAPTAGLHMTQAVLDKLDKVSLSLHVGAGTFQPVVNPHDHVMHGESWSVDISAVQRVIEAIKARQRIVAVGTTSVRTLESLYWCGVRKLTGGVDSLELGQFDWVDMRDTRVSAVDALQAVIEGKSSTGTLHGRTRLFIVPPLYEFRVVDELITNFHAPDSTLMLLVAAFCKSGSKVKAVYEEAQDKGYRFLSYGDACYFVKPQE
jgi:S-adenosylmethionine:tRNA ribosyltransferase-isomerase